MIAQRLKVVKEERRNRLEFPSGLPSQQAFSYTHRVEARFVLLAFLLDLSPLIEIGLDLRTPPHCGHYHGRSVQLHEVEAERAEDHSEREDWGRAARGKRYNGDDCRNAERKRGQRDARRAPEAALNCAVSVKIAFVSIIALALRRTMV